MYCAFVQVLMDFIQCKSLKHNKCLMFLKVSSAHQGCIHLIKKCSKNSNIVEIVLQFKIMFSM